MTSLSLFDEAAPAKQTTGAAPAVTIYSDGACSGNPGAGGWGALLMFSDGQEIELCGSQANATNNQMELMGAIAALESLAQSSLVTLFTDSQYVQKGFSEWLPGWKAKGWRTSTGSAVKNEDLWRRLEKAAQKHRLTIKWVRGHNGDPGNERADKLAVAGVAKAKRG